MLSELIDECSFLTFEVEITNGRKGSWYEHKVGKRYDVFAEQEFLTNNWEVIDEYERIHLINKNDCKIIGV